MKYETIEEAIMIANGTRYGLGASVFGPDQEKCYKVAQQLHCGMVSINDFAVYYVSYSFILVRPKTINAPFVLAIDQVSNDTR